MFYLISIILKYIFQYISIFLRYGYFCVFRTACELTAIQHFGPKLYMWAEDHLNILAQKCWVEWHFHKYIYFCSEVLIKNNAEKSSGKPLKKKFGFVQPLLNNKNRINFGQNHTEKNSKLFQAAAHRKKKQISARPQDKSINFGRPARIEKYKNFGRTPDFQTQKFGVRAAHRKYWFRPALITFS